MRIASLALVTAVAGCSAPYEYDTVYHADTSFTVEEQNEIQIAAAQLEEHTGQTIVVVFDGAPAVRTIHRSPTGMGGTNDLRFEHMQTIHVGILATGSRQDLSTAAQDVGCITAHELAHGLGFDHVSDPMALMAKDWFPGGFKWTAADEVEMVRARARGWKMPGMN
jgi:hypothetical protein